MRKIIKIIAEFFISVVIFVFLFFIFSLVNCGVLFHLGKSCGTRPCPPWGNPGFCIEVWAITGFWIGVVIGILLVLKEIFKKVKGK